MSQPRNIRELQAYVKQMRSVVIAGHSAAMIQITKEAEKEAKENVTKQFTGRNERKLTGRLLNAVFSGFVFGPRNELPSGFVGTRGIPYGAIHEFGGVIRPKKAKNLWIKNWAGKAKKYKRLTPAKWFDLWKKSQAGTKMRDPTTGRFRKEGQGQDFHFAGRSAGVTENGEYTPLFFLVNKVEMPARPYLTPAVEKSVALYPKLAIKRTNEFFAARLKGKFR